MTPQKEGEKISYRRLVRSLTVRSAVFLVAILLLALGSFAIFVRQSRAFELDAGVVNLSGSQRMLSQRAALLVEELVSAAGMEKEQLQAELLRTADRFEENHRKLVAGNLSQRGDVPRGVIEIAERDPHRLDEKVRRFTNALRDLAGRRELSAADHEVEYVLSTALDGTLLESLDALVVEFQEQSERNHRRLRGAAVLLVGTTLAVLLIVVQIVLLPLFRGTADFAHEARSSEARFRQVAENIREVFWLFEPQEGRFLYVTPSYERIWGRRVEKLLSDPADWLRAVFRGDRRYLLRFLRFQGGLPPFEVEFRIVDSRGRVRWIHNRGFPVAGREGQSSRIAGIAEEVTEERRTSQHLRQQSEELELVIANAPIGIAICDLSGRLIQGNRALCSSLAISESALDGRIFGDFVHPSSERSYRQVLDLASADRVQESTPLIRLLREDGTVARGTLHSGLVHGPEGRPDFLVLQFQDKTRELEVEVEARDQRERLAHVTRLASLGEMAAGLAHEMNQPLTAIAVYAQACRRMLDSGRMRASELSETLSKMSRQAHRAGEVIRRLRSFVKRRESGYETVNLNDVVTAAIALARPETRFRNLEIRSELASSLQPVTVDVVQIQQVLLNLIRNAAEALDSIEAEDPLIVRTAPAPEEFVAVSVIDRGVGLPVDSQRQVFQPFYTTKESGLGLGLSISQSIIRSHGGEMWYEQNPDRGSCFRFKLPTALSVGGPGEGPGQPESAAREAFLLSEN